MIRRSVVCVAAVAMVLSESGFCGEWPAYRADAARSGATGEQLEFPLNPAWVYVPPRPPVPAWPEAADNVWDIHRRGDYAQSLNPDPLAADYQVDRVDFDYAPQPVVAGGMVYFGSTTDDTVRAVELSTGRLVWRFTAGGPVRFAPAIDAGRAYVASDDGRLYCLDAATGEPVWSFSAAPKGNQIIGNGRMISRWPLRSGVLVRDGVAYITAGMWPAEGVFVYALDAETGNVLWCNDTSNAMWMDQPHGGAYALTGVVPQGYLLASKDVLLVPTGRSVPAGYDRDTGRLLYYKQANNKALGGVWACIDERRGQFFNRSVGSRMVTYSLASGDGARGRAGDQLVIGPDGQYVAVGNSLQGPGWRKAHPPGRVHSLALAGGTLLAGGAGSITAYEAATGEVTWQAEVEGEVRGIAVADGCLVASTSEGAVYCFQPGLSAGAEPTQMGGVRKSAPIQGGTAAVRRVVALLKDSNVTRGYALVIGSPDARLGEALASQTALHVVSALGDRAEVSAERERLLTGTDLCGSRIAVQYLAGGSDLPYTSYFANLVVVCGEAEELSGEELYRVLRPCGGVMCFTSAGRARAEELLREGDVPAEEIRPWADSVTVVRGKLPGAFDWDSEVTCDQRVRWPLELLWFGGPGPARMSDRHWGSPTPVAANGRYFAIGEHHVIAVDAYNGCELWARPVPNALSRPLRLLTGLAADDENVYLSFGHTSYQLDAQTGRQVKVYGDFKPSESYSLAQSRVFNFKVDESHSGTVGLKNSSAGLLVALRTVDPALTRWDGWELFFDFRAPSRRAELYGPGVFQEVVQLESGTCQPGVGPQHPEVSVTPRSSANGSEINLLLPWDEISKIAGFKPADFAFAAVLVSDDPQGMRKTSVFGDTYAYVLNNGWPTFVLDSSGKVAPPSGATPVPVAGSSELPALARQGGRLPARPRDETQPDKLSRIHAFTGQTQARSYIKAYGCGGTISSAAMDFFRSGTLGFFDFQDDSGIRNFGGMRPGCGASCGLLPALGLLISNEASSGCTCSYNLKCSLALAPAVRRSDEDWAIHYSESEIGSLLQSTALNFGAPGDRRDGKGVLWLGFPRPWAARRDRGKDSITLTVPLHQEGYGGLDVYRASADRVAIGATESPWVYSSGYRGLKSAVLDLSFYEPVLAHPSLQCERAPRIDGDLGDGCWDGSGRVCFPKQNAYIYCWQPNAPELLVRPDSTVYLRHDERNLYIACARSAKVDDDGRAIPWTARTQGQDAPVWQDDSLEMYITADGVPKFVHLGLAASGARYDGLWNGVFDVPRLDDVAIDGGRGDWDDGGFRVNLFDKGQCRVGWSDRGLLLLGELAEGFFAGDRRYPNVVFMAVDAASGDSLQLFVAPEEGTCLMEHYAGGRVEESRVQPTVRRTDGGCVVEALFPWEALNVGPAMGKEIGFAVACIPVAGVDQRHMRNVAHDLNYKVHLRLAERPSPPAELGDPGVPASLLVEEDAGWNGTWSGAVRMDRGSLTTEVAIPWATLAAVGLERDALRVKFDKTGIVAQSIQEAKGEYLPPLDLTAPETSVKPYTVRLHFAEPDDVGPGRRVFDVKLQGRTVLEGLDVVKEADGRFRALVKEFKGVLAENALTVELVPRSDDLTPATTPILSGLEVMIEGEGE